MEAVVASEFRMEGCGQHFSLLGGDDLTAVFAAVLRQADQDSGRAVYRFNKRGSNKNCVEGRRIGIGLRQKRSFEVNFKTIDLPPEGVAFHDDIHYAQ